MGFLIVDVVETLNMTNSDYSMVTYLSSMAEGLQP